VTGSYVVSYKAWLFHAAKGFEFDVDSSFANAPNDLRVAIGGPKSIPSKVKVGELDTELGYGDTAGW
jgi:hypothetical protein